MKTTIINSFISAAKFVMFALPASAKALGSISAINKKRKGMPMLFRCQRLCLLVTILVFLTGLIGTGFAATYDVAADFSTASNPNGAWSYGWSSGRGTPLNLYDLTFYGCTLGCARAWMAEFASLGAPDVALAIDNIITHPTVFLPAGTVSFHPGPQGQNSVIRWTAPVCGEYNISGNFIGRDFVFPTTTDVAILHGQTEIFSSNINSYGIPYPFSIDLKALPGETIDFTVGFGSDGNFYGDSTGIAAKITSLYSFSGPGEGFQPPVTLERPFQLGSTIPVKFVITDGCGGEVKSASATLMVQKLNSGTADGDTIDATSNVPGQGNAFRYDGSQYIYNLATNYLGVGSWRLIVIFDNGQVETKDIRIK